MAIQMTNKARDAARSLAIAYDAYHEAKKEGRNSGIVVWGDALIEAQDQIGVFLLDPANIRTIIDHARATA